MTDEDFIPDFSGDDFANDKEIQRSRAAIKAYEKMMDDAMSAIRRQLGVQDASHINLKGFMMFRSLTATITHSMKCDIHNHELRVALAEYASSYPTPRSYNTGTDEYLFGYITLTNNYPHTYIHKETIKEKIEDLFLKRDIDFPGSKKLSGRFQVLSDDKDRLLGLLQFKKLDELTVFPDMEMEFLNNAVLFRSSRKPVSAEETNIFCSMCKVVLNVFG